MSNTYSQIYIHIIFAVQGRQHLIHERNREELQKYITGITQDTKHKMIAIYCMPDHSHLFVGLKPSIAVSDFVGTVKTNSSNYINEKRWVDGRFNWQEGFGAFSYSRSQIDVVVQYILNQKDHHKKRTFKEEYVDFLKKFAIEYDEKYLFEWIEEAE